MNLTLECGRKLSKLAPALLLFAAIAQAQPVQETLVVTGSPSLEQVRQWSARSPGRSYVFRWLFPNPGDVRNLLELRGFKSLAFELGAYPDESSLAAWRELASRGAEFTGQELQLPTTQEVDLLNAIGFRKQKWVIPYYPDFDEAERLGHLASLPELSFTAPQYPRYDDKELLLAIPTAIPLDFHANYWPWYTHMDVLNLLPHAQALSVSGSYPSQDHLEYLTNLKNLRRIHLSVSYEPSEPSLWNQLGTAEVVWECSDYFPTPEALRAFAASGPGKRLLILRQEMDLSTQQRALLESLSIPVEWIRSGAY